MTGWPGRRGKPRPTRAPARDRTAIGERSLSDAFGPIPSIAMPPRVRFAPEESKCASGVRFSHPARGDAHPPPRSIDAICFPASVSSTRGDTMLRPMDAPRRRLLPLGTDWLFRRARPRPGRTDGKAIRSVTGARVLLSLAGRRPRRIRHGLIVRRPGLVCRAGRVASGGTATGIEIVLRLIGSRRRRRCVRAGPARAGSRVTGRARSSRTRPGSSRRARATRGRASTCGSSTAPSSCAPGTGASSASSTSRALRIDAGGRRQRRK